MSLEDAYSHYLPLVEALLSRIVGSGQRSLWPYYGMMRYHLGWTDEALRPLRAPSGKRLRPMLCLLTCAALGGDTWSALPAAAAVELVHNFSLVHDDIQDGSRLRRGRPAVWDLWGVPQAINAGDGLFVLARMALLRLGEPRLPDAARSDAAMALDQACLALCEGQYLDMAFELQARVTVGQYIAMIRSKTAALLAASAQLGAIVATDDRGAVSTLFRFGENLGMAFQVQDDVLGTWGDERVTGKSVATDVRDRKKTLPVVYALNQVADREAADRLAQIYLQPAPLSQEDIRAAVSILDQTGARGFAEDLASEYYRRAERSLGEVSIRGGSKDPLFELAASLVQRTY